jgi:hypothetical protein
MQKAISGFGAAGVWNVNPEMFTDVDFEPAQQTTGVEGKGKVVPVLN